MELNIDYTIGDDIVAIKDQTQGVFKRNETFKCIGLSISKCKCKRPLVNIGMPSQGRKGKCSICNVCNIEIGDYALFNATSFRKLDNLVQISEIHELLNETVDI